MSQRVRERERERERALASGESLRILPRIKAWRKERDTQFAFHFRVFRSQACEGKLERERERERGSFC